MKMIGADTQEETDLRDGQIIYVTAHDGWCKWEEDQGCNGRQAAKHDFVVRGRQAANISSGAAGRIDAARRTEVERI